MLLGASARSKLAFGSRAAVALAAKPAQVPWGSRGLKIPVNAAAVVVALVSPLCMASTAMIRATATAAATTAATIRSTAISVV